MEHTQLRFIVVAAHPHDFTHYAATLGIHTSLGDSVTLVVATSGALTHNEKLRDELKKPPEQRNPDIVNEPPDKYAAQKREELVKAAAIFGVTDVRILDGPQPFIADQNPQIIAQMTEIIQEIRPHILINQSPFLQVPNERRGLHMLEAGGQDDHIQTAFAFQKAQKYASQPSPENPTPPHNIAATFYPGVYFSQQEWDFAIDVTDWFDKRVEAENLFKSQGHWEAWSQKRIEMQLAGDGWAVNAAYAEGWVRRRIEVLPKISLSPLTIRDAVEPSKVLMERLVGSPKPE